MYLPEAYSLIRIHTDPVRAVNPRINPTRRQALAARGFTSYPLSESWLFEIELTIINDSVPKIPNK